MQRRLHRTAVFVAVLAMAIVWLPSIAGARASHPAAVQGGMVGDFNGDGFADLAVGVPEEDTGSGNSVKNVGAVSVIYGSATGLTGTGNQFWTQNSAGILDQNEPNDEFGSALAVGDFNGDGVSDLAVGEADESTSGHIQDGAVNVIYGALGSGLTSTGNQFFSQAGLLDGPEDFDHFGHSLTAGDFNGDGAADLAIGDPGEDLNGVTDAGAVDVLYGAVGTGLSTTGNQIWSEGLNGVPGTPQQGDEFGQFSLAAADFNVDGTADLAVGTPLDDEAPAADSGSVVVLPGSLLGLTSVGVQLWTQDSDGVAGIAEATDEFGAALAAGDFNGDLAPDLAIGSPGEDLGTGNTVKDTGGVNVLFGTAAIGLTSTGNQQWTQDSAGILGTAAANDAFGNYLAGADFGGTPEADLAIGVVGDKVGTVAAGGAVAVLFGSTGGLTSTGNQLWTQDSVGIKGAAEAGDSFGFDVGAGDFGNGPQADLVVGVPLEDVGAKLNAGVANVLYGGAAGLSSTGNQYWSQDASTIIGLAETGDRFGWARGFATQSSSAEGIWAPSD
jgi:FG-GAP repeat protein